MSKITQEQYELLKANYTVPMLWALRSSCVPAFSRSDLEFLTGVYRTLGHSLESSTCGHCILSMVQIIAKAYNEYEEELKKEVKEEYNGEREKDKDKGSDSSSNEHKECGVYEEYSDPGADGEEARHEAETKEGAASDTEKVASRRSRKRSNFKPNV